MAAVERNSPYQPTSPSAANTFPTSTSIKTEVESSLDAASIAASPTSQRRGEKSREERYAVMGVELVNMVVKVVVMVVVVMVVVRVVKIQIFEKIHGWMDRIGFIWVKYRDFFKNGFFKKYSTIV